MNKLLIIFFTLFVSHNIYASNHFSSHYLKSKKLIKKFKKKNKRTIASDFQITESYLTKKKASYIDTVNNFINIKSAHSFYNLISKLDTNYNSLSSVEEKLLVINAGLMLPMKGVLWRTDHVLGSYVGDGYKTSMNSLQNGYNSILSSLFQYNNFWSSGLTPGQSSLAKHRFDYLTIPNEKFTFNPINFPLTGEKKQELKLKKCLLDNPNSYHGKKMWGQVFKRENNFKSYLACEVLPAVSVGINRVQRLINELEATDMASVILWDNKIFYNQNSYSQKDGTDVQRFKKITIGDLYSFLASLYSTRNATQVLLAYNLAGLIQTTNNLGVVLGNPGKALKRTNAYKDPGLTNKKRVNIIKKAAGGTFLSAETELYGFTYQDRMLGAYNDLKRWYENIELAKFFYEGKSSFSLSDKQLIANPALYEFLDTRTINSAMATIRELIFSNSSQIISSSINSGLQVKVNFSNFYLNPTNDLKKFLPNQWKENENELLYTKVKKIKSRNYQFEAPLHWDYSFYGEIFPDIKKLKSQNAKREHVIKASRALSESVAGPLFLPILGNLLL